MTTLTTTPIAFVVDDDITVRESLKSLVQASGWEAETFPSAQAFATYHAYVDRGRKIPNLRYVGRHAEFKYWGVPETVNSAYLKALEFPAV